MGMTIDKSTKILVDRYIDTYVVCGGANYNPTINITREDYEAFKVAIDTMRKYQKIEKVVDRPTGTYVEEKAYNYMMIVEDIKEVLEDGKID